MALGPHEHPFYRPLWRRIAIVASTIVWTSFEYFMGGSGFWTVIALAVCGYSIWTFLWTYPKDTPSTG
jgi:hypothetical protein